MDTNHGNELEPDALRQNPAWRALNTPLPFPVSVRRWLFRNREDWRTVVRASGLPGTVQHAVALIVRRTRLWRSEKTEVARELCAHFTDGIVSGREAEELCRAFGDPKAAATLIRNAKRRGRPLWWQTWRYGSRGIGVVLLVLLGIYGVMALLFFAYRPSIKRNFAAELNAPILAVPEAQRAWPVYFEAIKKIGKLPDSLVTTQMPETGTGKPQEPEDTWPQKPRDRRWPEAAAWVESQRDGVAMIRRAAGMEHLGFPLLNQLPEDYRRWQAELAGTTLEAAIAREANPPLVGVLLPYLGEFRIMARMIVVDARIAAQTNDADRFVGDIRAMCGLARQCDEVDTFINKLVQVAILGLAEETLKEWLNADALTPVHLRDLAHQFGAFDNSVIRAPLDLERNFLRDFVQRSYSDDGHGNGHMTHEGLRMLESITTSANSPFVEPGHETILALAGPLSVAGMASRKELLAEMERLFALSEREGSTPQWERAESAADVAVVRLSEGVVSRARYAMLITLIPALGKVHASIEQARQTRDGILVALATESYRREHGVYPPALDALVPGLLPSVPVDRYDGKPLKYRIIGDGSATVPVIYSIGVDRIDDGGRGPKDPRNVANMFAYKTPARMQQIMSDPGLIRDQFGGDWVLYRPHTEPAGGPGKQNVPQKPE